MNGKSIRRICFYVHVFIEAPVINFVHVRKQDENTTNCSKASN